jgi:hypothetical protein
MLEDKHKRKLIKQNTMTKYLQFVFGLTFLLLTGCISQEIQEAASEAASIIKATKYKIGKGTAAGTNRESHNSLNIEFSEFDGSIDGYDNEKISSIAVLAFYRNLKPKDYSGFEKIKVILNRQNTTVETLYDIKQLNETHKYFKVANDLITSIHDRSIPAMKACIDTMIIDRNFQDGIYNVFDQLDSAYGQFNDNMFTGFKFSETKDGNIPVFVTWCELQHESTTTDLKLIINRSTDKIIFIGFNE